MFRGLKNWQSVHHHNHKSKHLCNKCSGVWKTEKVFIITTTNQNIYVINVQGSEKLTKCSSSQPQIKTYVINVQGSEKFVTNVTWAKHIISLYILHCTTSWKVTGSIPNEINGIFHCFNPSDHNIASNRNLYQEYLLGVKVAGTSDWNLPPSCANCLEIVQVSTSWTPMGLSRSVMGCHWFMHTYKNGFTTY
jgi:hypothetical protein